MKAKLFKTGGEVLDVSPENGKEFSLEEMYSLIECDMVEHVSLGDDVDMWVDEEGLLKRGWVFNDAATKFYRKAYPDVDPEELVIVGNALVVDNSKAQTFFGV